ncbi:MAG: hypothetical protein BWX69_03216 [Planctomycetes bacterium ADurb.Bin069]|nr:MAG: hypothetical protein BWX69_03216 [Planctomycetes bacterium ADurb.Bin069]
MRFIGAAPATIRSRISACAALIRASSSRRPGISFRSFGRRSWVSAGFWHHRILPASGPSVTRCARQCFASGLSLRGYGASHSRLIFTGFGADGGTAFLTQSQRSLTKTAVFSARHAGLPQNRQSLSMCGPVMPSPSRAVLFTVFLQSAHHSGWRSAQGILRMSRAPASQSARPMRSGCGSAASSVSSSRICIGGGSAASSSQKTCPAFFSAMVVRHCGAIAESLRRRKTQRSLTPSSRAISGAVLPPPVSAATPSASSSGDRSLRCRFSTTFASRAAPSSRSSATHGTMGSPASRAAARRRCPQTSSHRTPDGASGPALRTVSGFRTPLAAIEAASPASSSSDSAARVWYGEGPISASGTGSTSPCAGAGCGFRSPVAVES